jgi:hypothetical protein
MAIRLASCHPSLTNGGIHDRRFHFVLYGQTIGQECVLKRATSFDVRVGAAATVVIYSLDALMSPPVQRGGITQFVTLNPESRV